MGNKIKEYIDTKTVTDTFVAVYNTTTFAELAAAIAGGKSIFIKNISSSGILVDMAANLSTIGLNGATLKGVASDQSVVYQVTATVSNEDVWSSNFETILTAATSDDYGVVKLNPSESVTVNSEGQLNIGGRLGQMSNSTGIYSPKTINPAAVGNGSFLLTECSGLKLGNKSLAVVTGTGLSLKTAAAAGSTTYTVNNTYENRIICAGIVGGVLALNETTAAQNYVNITSVTIGGYAPSVSNYWTATGDITIKTDASINPTSSTSSVRPYATGESGFSNLFVGQLSGGKGGASIVVGQKVFSYSGNACAIVGASMYNTGNGNALFGRQHISKKNRSFLAGTGHDTTNGPSEGVAALGMWSDIKSDTSFAIGNGTDSNNRSNSFEIDTNGDTFLNGFLILKAPNGTQYKISVDNSGNLVTTTL